MAASSGVLPEVTDGERAFVEHILSSTEQSILYAVWVNKIKNKNYDRRLLVLTPYQLMTLKTKRIGDSLTVARVGHWFDIQKLTCLETRADLSEIQTEFGGFSFACVLPTVRAHQVVGVAQRAIHDVTCNWPRAYEFSVGRIERGQVVDVDLATELPALPLGGFVQTYLAAVVHANMAIPDHRDILDFIVKHSSGRAVELHGPRDELQRMDQKSSNSVSYEPIGTALASNNFYEVFSMSDIHGPEVVEVLASALTTNTTLSVLEIRNVGATRGFDSLGTAIADNPGCRLTTLTLANNMIKDKAALKLARGLATLEIEFLDLSECSLSPKGLASLARSVAVSETLPQSLRFLNLSKNRFNQSSTTAIAGWIHSLKALEELVLASCSVDVSELSIVFPESACSALATVDLSANAISDQDAVKLSRALTRSRCSTLDLSECRASLQSIAGVFGTMTSTTRAEGACLIANGIRVATEDASRLSWAFSHGECLDTVSLTNCQLGVVGLCTIMDGLLKCPHLRRMGLSGNIRTKEKGIDEVVARLVEVVNERPIEVLELQGSSKSRFGTHLIPFFYCLQHNTTLRQLDISGNHVGDDGVSALAEVLQYTALEFLSIDENQPSLVGIRSFAAGVAQSRSIVDLPIPNSDYKHLMKASRDNQDLKTELNSIIKTMRMQVAHNANKVQDGDARMAELIGNMTDEEWLEADKIQRRERRRIRKVMRQEAARAENLQRTQRANKRKTIIMPRKTSTYGTRPGSHYAGVSLRQASMLTPVGNNNSNPVISSTHRERSHIRDVYDLFDTAAEMLNASDSDDTDDGAGFGSSNDDGGAPGTSGSEPLVPGPVDGLPEATDDDEVSSVSAASTPVGVGGSDGSDDAFPAATPELVAPPDLPPPMESLLRSIGS